MPTEHEPAGGPSFRVMGLVLWGLVGVALIATYVVRNQTDARSDVSPASAEPEDPTAPQTESPSAPPQVTIHKNMQLVDFELTNSRGETVTKADVVGKPAVFAFIFTRCISTCPPITLEMKKLHDKFKDSDVRFFCVTVDPDFDTVEHFANWSENYAPDRSRWQFLTGSKKQIHDMIVGGFELVIKEAFGENVRPGYEVTHTNRVVLVSAEGYPVESYLILNDIDRAKLYRVLEGRAPFPEPQKPGDVATLTRSNGETESLSADK